MRILAISAWLIPLSQQACTVYWPSTSFFEVTVVQGGQPVLLDLCQTVSWDRPLQWYMQANQCQLSNHDALNDLVDHTGAVIGTNLMTYPCPAGVTYYYRAKPVDQPITGQFKCTFQVIAADPTQGYAWYTAYQVNWGFMMYQFTTAGYSTTCASLFSDCSGPVSISYTIGSQAVNKSVQLNFGTSFSQPISNGQACFINIANVKVLDSNNVVSPLWTASAATTSNHKAYSLSLQTNDQTIPSGKQTFTLEISWISSLPNTTSKGTFCVFDVNFQSSNDCAINFTTITKSVTIFLGDPASTLAHVLDSAIQTNGKCKFDTTSWSITPTITALQITVDEIQYSFAKTSDTTIPDGNTYSLKLILKDLNKNFTFEVENLTVIFKNPCLTNKDTLAAQSFNVPANSLSFQTTAVTGQASTQVVNFSLAGPTNGIDCGPLTYNTSVSNQTINQNVLLTNGQNGLPDSITLNPPTSLLSSVQVTGTITITLQMPNYPSVWRTVTYTATIYNQPCSVTSTLNILPPQVIFIGDPPYQLAHKQVNSLTKTGFCMLVYVWEENNAAPGGWMTADATNYRILQTTISGSWFYVGDHLIKLYVKDTNYLTKWEIEQLPATILNPCLTQMNALKQPQVLLDGGFAPSLQTMTLEGKPQTVTFNEFTLATPPTNGSPCAIGYTIYTKDPLFAPFVGYLSLSKVQAQLQQNSQYRITLSVPQTIVPNAQLIGSFQLLASFTDFPGILQEFTYPITLTNPPCKITSPSTPLPQQTMYIGEEAFSFAHFNMKMLQTYGDCSKANFIFIHKVDGIQLNSAHPWLLASETTYTLLHSLAISEAGTHQVTCEILDQDNKKTFTIENFQVTLINPCIGALILPQKLSDLEVKIGETRSFLLPIFTYEKVRKQNGALVSSDLYCGDLSYQLEFKDKIMDSIIKIAGTQIVIDTTTGIASKFAGTKTDVCLIVSMSNQPSVADVRSCFQVTFSKQAQVAQAVAAPITVEVNVQMTEEFIEPFQKLDREVTITQVRQTGPAGLALIASVNGRIQINWATINELNLFGQDLEVLYTLAESTQPVLVKIAIPQKAVIDEPAQTQDETSQTKVESLDGMLQAFEQIIAQDTESEQTQIKGKLDQRPADAQALIDESHLINSDYNFFANHVGLSDEVGAFPLKARIQYVSSTGIVKVQFNQRIVFPNWFIDVVNFFSNEERLQAGTRGLETCIEPCSKIELSSEVLGFAEKFKEKPLLGLTVFMHEFESESFSSEQLSYTWNVTAVHDETSTFEIKLAFSNPAELSATSQPEYIKVDFNYPEYFQNTQGSSLNTRNVVKVIPTQWPSQRAANVLLNAGQAASVLMKGSASFSFALSWILSFSLSLLWGLINVIQMIVILPLVEINYPTNAMTLNSFLLRVANFDIIPSSTIAAKALTFGPQVPFSESFERFGNSSYFMMLSMGTSFFIFFGSILFLPIISAIASLIDRRYGEDYPRVQKWCRKVKTTLEYGYYIRMIFEVYLDLAINSFVNLYSLKYSFDSWSLTGDMASGIFTVIAVTIVALTPLVAGAFLIERKQHIESTEFVAKFGELIQATKSQRYYNCVVFLARRLLTALILVCLRRKSFFQIIFLAYLQLAYIIYIGLAKPLSESSDNNRELFQEVMTMLCIYHLFIFSDWVATVSATATYNAGWTQCLIILFVILEGIYQLVQESVEAIKLKWRQYRYRKMEKLLLQHRKDQCVVHEDSEVIDKDPLSSLEEEKQSNAEQTPVQTPELLSRPEAIEVQSLEVKDDVEVISDKPKPPSSPINYKSLNDGLTTLRVPQASRIERTRRPFISENGGPLVEASFKAQPPLTRVAMQKAWKIELDAIYQRYMGNQPDVLRSVTSPVFSKDQKIQDASFSKQ